MASGALKEWRDFPPGKEKYQLYLASREWALLREAVRARSGGACERCRSGPASQVHHQTYERVYAEALDDLVHLCTACHQFLSAKADDDPAAAPPVIYNGGVIRSIYLAGHVHGDHWRDQIAPGWSHISEEIAGDQWGDDCGRGRVVLPDGRRLDLTGPFPAAADDYFQERSIVKASLDAILRSDLVFAWAGNDDRAEDVIFQLGYARAIGKETALFFAGPTLRYSTPFLLQEMEGGMPAVSASDAWDFCWSYQQDLLKAVIGPAGQGVLR